MAEEFLMLLADFDDESQRIMSGWYEKLHAEGFVGKQTPNLLFHISLAGFSLDKESEAVSDMNDIVGEEDDGTVTVLWFKLSRKPQH